MDFERDVRFPAIGGTASSAIPISFRIFIPLLTKFRINFLADSFCSGVAGCGDECANIFLAGDGVTDWVLVWGLIELAEPPDTDLVFLRGSLNFVLYAYGIALLNAPSLRDNFIFNLLCKPCNFTGSVSVI